MLEHWQYVREKRIVVIFCLFITLFFGVFLKLSNIQVFKSSDLAMKAVQQQTREVSLEIKSLQDRSIKPLQRGEFYDRRHQSLLDSQEETRVIVFPQFLEDVEGIITSLSNILNKFPWEIRDLIKDDPVILPFEMDEVQIEKVKELKVNGVAVTKVYARYGPSPLATNLLGYLEDKDGVTGLELKYNTYLKGVESEKALVAQVNVNGQLIPGIGLNTVSRVDSNRKHVVTTIDKRIQVIVEDIMDQYVEEGAVVVMEVATGDILASATRPTFNPTNMKDIKDQWVKINDRAVQFRESPPGSVFKVLVAAAAIEEGIADETSQFECDKKYFDCSHAELPHLTLSQALAVSCNNTFAKLALQLGKDKLINYIKKFNLDTQTIIGYPAESSQLVSDLQADHTLVTAAIGQGKVHLSPIQVTTILNTIANGGIYRSPRLVQQLIESSGKEYKRYVLSPGEQIISFDTAQKVHRMLTRVTSSGYGTGQEAYIEGYGSAGKTGTAEVDKLVEGKKESYYISWFSGYAPVQKPEYVITVLIEKSKEEGTRATKVFKEAMAKSLNIEIK